MWTTYVTHSSKQNIKSAFYNPIDDKLIFYWMPRLLGLNQFLSTWNHRIFFSWYTWILSLWSLAMWLPRILPWHVRFPLRLHWFILCTRLSGGAADEGGGCDQSIGSTTVSDAIVRSCLWLATRSSPLGYFSNHCK